LTNPIAWRNHWGGMGQQKKCPTLWGSCQSNTNTPVLENPDLWSLLSEINPGWGGTGQQKIKNVQLYDKVMAGGSDQDFPGPVCYGGVSRPTRIMCLGILPEKSEIY